MANVMRREAGHLPAELTSFVGRRQATSEIKHALTESRMVTLTGVGGVGKSRLALHVAHEIRRAFPDGIWLVELAELTDATLVAHTVAVTLHLLDQSVRDAESVLVDYLTDKRILLVLDNCEHLLDACGNLAEMLLAAASDVRVLATSREPLRVSAENIWQVPPLSVPTTANGATPDETPSADSPHERPSRRHEALLLFEDRAASGIPGFTLNRENEDVIGQLCQRLDGIPLAIELAAVRLRVLSAEQILSRLEDRFHLLTTGSRGSPARHQTLQAAVGWSYDLCSETERTLWSRCSVFTGEFDLGAAEQVCTDEGMAAADVLTGIAGLVNKSVLTRGESGNLATYRMLETIRQYGRERLAEAGEDDTLRRRHRDYYLMLAEQSDVDSCGPHQPELVRTLRFERANIMTALEYCLDTPGEARIGLRMATALWFYWIACGFVRDGRRVLDRALDLDTEPSSERAHGLWISGWIAHLQGDIDASLALHHQSRELANRLGDQTAMTYAMQFLGDAKMWAGDLTHALPLLEEVLDRHRSAHRWTAPALLVFALRAQAAGLLGDPDQAMRLLAECRSLCEKLGEQWALSWTEWNVAVTWWAAGEPDKAAEHVRTSLRHKHDLDDLLGIPCCVELLAWVAATNGKARHAAVLFGALRELWKPIGRPLFDSETLLTWSREAAELSRKTLGGTQYVSAMRQGAQLTHDELISCALGEKAFGERERNVVAESSGKLVTKREQEVAELVTSGMSNREIAAKLVISQRTVDSHVDHILSKLGFTSRVQIAAWVVEQRNG